LSWTSRWDRVDRDETPIGRATAQYSPDEYSPIVYGRGPLFLAALENLMGRAAFLEFMRDYFETFTWDIATGEGFRSLAERHCGCDLTDMWASWVDG
jgi:aminopeptidase N